MFATSHTTLSPSARLASATHLSRTSSLRPTTESMPWSPTFAAAAIDSARTLTTLSPSSNVIAPANTSAVYSPSDRPAHAEHDSTTAGESTRSFSTAARPARKSAGCANSVASSFSFGPLTQTSSRSYPRISFALSHISLPAGMCDTDLSMPTAWEPCPGKRKATGESFAAAAPGTAGTTYSPLSVGALAPVTAGAFAASPGGVATGSAGVPPVMSTAGLIWSLAANSCEAPAVNKTRRQSNWSYGK